MMRPVVAVADACRVAGAGQSGWNDEGPASDLTPSAPS